MTYFIEIFGRQGTQGVTVKNKIIIKGEISDVYNILNKLVPSSYHAMIYSSNRNEKPVQLLSKMGTLSYGID